MRAYLTNKFRAAVMTGLAFLPLLLVLVAVLVTVVELLIRRLAR